LTALNPQQDFLPALADDHLPREREFFIDNLLVRIHKDPFKRLSVSSPFLREIIL
jgi:hypothetical protein